MRESIAKTNGGKPEDFTWEDLKTAALDLCRHYGRVQVVPATVEDGVVQDDIPEAIGDARFWTERGEEFRMHDTPENTMLLAMRFSSGWVCLGGSDEAEQSFKPLAREAAKGFGSPPSAESWQDWLTVLSRARDRSSKKPLYSKVMTGAAVDFSLRSDSAALSASNPSSIETTVGDVHLGLHWETTCERLERLFRISAGYCRELRSLAPPQDTVARGGIGPTPWSLGAIHCGLH